MYNLIFLYSYIWPIVAITAQEKLKVTRFIQSNQLNIQIEYGFRNYSANSQNKNALILNIASLKALQSILKYIHQLNEAKSGEYRIIVRAAAGGKGDAYSASYSVHGPVESDIIARLTGPEFAQVKQIDAQAQTITVGPNVQIGDAESLLAKKKLSLSTTPLNPYITLVGLATYGGVGTGVEQGTFSGLLISYTLCLQNGSITTIDKTHPDFTILSAANCGLLGIIISATFKCCDTTTLRLVETPTCLYNVISQIKNKDNPLFKRKPYTSIFIVPDFTASASSFNTRVYQWQPVPEETPAYNTPTALRHYWQTVQTTLVETLNIPAVLNYYPSLVPHFMRLVMKPITIGEACFVATGPAHILFHHQTGYLQHGIEDVGWAIPDDGTGTQAAGALQYVADYLRKLQLEGKFPVTAGGIYVRYIKGSQGMTQRGLSMCSINHYTCLIDIVSNKHAPGFEELQAYLTKSLEKQFNAVPHLGKYIPQDYKIAQAAAFVDALKTFYKANHLDIQKNMFLTAHFCQLLAMPEYAPKRKQVYCGLFQHSQARNESKEQFISCKL